MDPEDQKPKITLANFFESIKGTNAIAQRALKMSSGFSKAIKESSDLVEVNKQDIQELQRKVATISQDVTNIQDYIEDQQERRSRELDKREDEVFEKEDKLQKEFKGEGAAKGAGGATSTADALGKGAGAFISSGLGFGLMGLNALMSPRSVGEIFGGTVDAITGNFTDLDKRGGETGGATRALGGIVDFFTANMFDLDKRGGLFESKESFERRKEIDEKKKEEKKNRPKKGLMRLLPFNDGGKVFDNVYKSPKLLSFNLLPFNDGGKVFDNDGNSSNNNVDSVLAMLTPGEFVMKKEAVDRLGEGFLASLNEGKSDKKTNIQALLNTISIAEGTGKGGYGTIYGGTDDNPITVPELSEGKMTINQVLNMMETGKIERTRMVKNDKGEMVEEKYMADVGYGRENNVGATGRYQFIPAALREEVNVMMKKDKNLSLDSLLTPQLQDKLMLQRLKEKRKIDFDNLEGGIKNITIDKLSEEFESFPNLLPGSVSIGDKDLGPNEGRTDQSFYDEFGTEAPVRSEEYIKSIFNQEIKKLIPSDKKVSSGLEVKDGDMITMSPSPSPSPSSSPSSSPSFVMPSAEDSSKDLSVNIAQNPSEGGGDNSVEILDTITQNMGGSSGDGTGSTIQPQFDLADTSSPAVMNPESPSEFIALLTDTSNSAFR